MPDVIKVGNKLITCDWLISKHIDNCIISIVINQNLDRQCHYKKNLSRIKDTGMHEYRVHHYSND